MPSLIFTILMLIYPFWKLIKLTRVNRNLKHTLPRIERNCQLAFIRENMLLAVVLDSFAITNYESICKKNLPFGFMTGAVTFFL